MTKRDLKIVAGTVTIIGIILSLIKFYYAPEYIESPDNISSVFQTDIFGGLVLVATSIAPIAYIIIDVLDNRRATAEKASGDDMGTENCQNMRK